jgi:ABC-type uncharacterized transport system ATPase subunit
MAPALEVRGLQKRYGARMANDGVQLCVPAGSVHALVGENGAGKSTVCKALFGLVRPDAGTILIEGREAVLRSPREAMARGVGMVHQHFMLVHGLTAAQNVTLGSEPTRGGLVDAAAARLAVRALSDRYGLAVEPDAPVEELPVGVQQRVEILKALHGGARILILDEPTAVLTPMEVEALFHVLRRLRADGTTVLMVTHKLTEVMAVCDDVTVMRAGRTVAARTVADTTPAELSTLMVGRDVDLSRRPRQTHVGKPLLEVTGLRVAGADGRPRVADLSFTLHEGEVLGVAGVEGNGQSELLEALCGVRPCQGRVLLGGEDLGAMGVRQRMERGLLHVPEDRLTQGLVPSMSVLANGILGLHHRPPFARAGLLVGAAAAAHAQTLTDAYDIRPPDASLPAAALSGGNQQKIVVGRALSARPRVILIAQPTRGVDVGAMERIHQAILMARDSGAAVLLISAELTELLSLADRLMVLYRGRAVLEADAAQATPQQLGPYMLTGAAA